MLQTTAGPTSPERSTIPTVNLSLDISHLPTSAVASTVDGLIQYGLSNAAIHSVLSDDPGRLEAVPDGVARILDTRDMEVSAVDARGIDRHDIDMVIMRQYGAWDSTAVRLARKGVAACVALEAGQTYSCLRGAISQAIDLQPYAYPRLLTTAETMPTDLHQKPEIDNVDVVVTQLLREHRNPQYSGLWFPNPAVKAPNVYVEQADSIAKIPPTIAKGESTVRVIVPLEQEVVDDGIVSVVAYLTQQVPELRLARQATGTAA